MKIFMTFNPHIKNLSQKNLLDDFKDVLKRYYRKHLGQRYFKHKEKQYYIAIFEEIGKKFYKTYDPKTGLITYHEIKNAEFKKEPHLHIIADVPLAVLKDFYYFLQYNMHKKYGSLTSEYEIPSTTVDERNIWNYCSKEGGNIFTKTDLFERITPINRIKKITLPTYISSESFGAIYTN